ncbi:hypothetical protein DFH09DRAFT_418991 [Mycena vulgaris]|nr:hypothetical protein DFH09DRAFT_418991 [Mycena vulgaris]
MPTPQSSPIGGAPQSPSATAMLASVIVPALKLAKAGATGIGIPGVEPAINGVLELAMMLSTMKENKEDLSRLETALNELITIDASGASGDLKQRLVKLSSELGKIAIECNSLTVQSRVKQFFKANDYKQRIQDIKNSIASHIHEFTFYGNISIETSVEGILKILKTELLAKLKYVTARYNADNTPNKCMDGTRVNIIKDIVMLLTSTPSASERIVMLSGPAGSGKSTIAKSVASIIAEEKGILAASFFFSRDYADRKEITHLATTLAFQLADYDTQFRNSLIDLLETDRTGILDAEPHLQFQKILVGTLEKMPPSAKPWIICLDALDECGKDRGQIFLRWLSDNITRIPAHIRFFLTGRPDVPSYLKLDTLCSLMHGIILNKIDLLTVSHDIRLYIKHSLDGSNWTTRHSWKIKDHDLEEITNRASGLFVFAATAVRYVLAGLPQVPPQKSVDYLLGGEPLNDLHALYQRIVDEAIPIALVRDRRAQTSYDQTMKILNTILHLVEPLDSHSLASLLQLDMEVLQGILLPLSAVIYTSGTPGVAIRIIHLSFKEFMTHHVQTTRPEVRCGTRNQQRSLASALVKLMYRKLRFNICDLPSSYLRNHEMPDLQRQVDRYIPGHLRYACRFWVDHLVATSYDSHSAQAAEKLLFKHFLFWLEVLSLLGMVDYAPQSLSKLTRWANQNHSLARFATDAKIFISFFRDAIVQSAPHIYISALALAPTQSEISQKFWPQFPKLLSISEGRMKKGPTTRGVSEGHTHDVNSVAFSPNDKYIVSGSNDRTVGIWNAETGALHHKLLMGHTFFVRCVAFSPSGKHIVSGSDDRTLCIWDVETGTSVGIPLKGHIRGVLSVAFSPDGKHIVSGSSDTTVRIWETYTGAAVGDPLKGHTNRVRSVAFSIDGKHLVSASIDNTLRIWNAENGAAIGEPLDGHTNWVNSVAYSPNGKHIASGSDDHTIRIWDAQSGAMIGEPFAAGTSIYSVAFSPDGKYIVSGSNNTTVCIWDAESGVALCRPLEGHTNWVSSVAFSSDGKYIVSASSDNTIRVWDVESVLNRPGAVMGSSGHVSHFPHLPSPSIPLHWRIRNGWVFDNPSEMLFWLPSTHRIGLWFPHNTLVIGRQQTRLSYDNFVHGTEWARCYLPVEDTS